MRSNRSVLFVLAVFLCGGLLQAQTSVPTASGSISAQTLSLGGPGATFDLRTVFTVPGVSGQLVQFDTVFGKFNVEMRADVAPQNVANFLNYVQAGAYTNTIFHRAVKFADEPLNSIVQGGGYRAQIANGTIPSIPRNAPVALEYNLPHVRGTIGAARLGKDPNTGNLNLDSATSEFFFNTRDNSTILDQSNNGGYTVFGRVVGTGMTVVDTLAGLTTRNVTDGFGFTFEGLPLRNYTSGSIGAENLVPVNSVSTISLYPTGGTSAVTFSASSSNSSVVAAALSGVSLVLTPVAAGTATINLTAIDTNGNSATSSFSVNVTAGPQFTTQPLSQGVTAGGSLILVASTSGSATYQWQLNGADIAGATGSALTVNNFQPANAGVYTLVATNGNGASTSQGAVVGIQSDTKVVGAASEIGSDIRFANGNFYDQVLLTGDAATIKADAGQVTRISYIDLTDDIVQVEFAGAGNLTISLDNPSGPAAPVHYNQPSTLYKKGHARITITGANESTNVSVFSVGRTNAFDPTGAYDFLGGITATNNPANNGSPLFNNPNHPISEYDAGADIATIAIATTNGKFGGVRTANTSYLTTRGFTGVYAPGVQFTGPVFVHDICAFDTATAFILLGSASDVRVTGGDLAQSNGRAVQVDGFTHLQMAAGVNSQGTAQPAQPLNARLERNGVDVTSQLTN